MLEYKQLIESIVATLLEKGDEDIHLAFKNYCSLMGETEYIKEDIQKFVREEYSLLKEEKVTKNKSDVDKMMGMINYERKQS